jgi:phosphatidylserine/phosphatidylglycerophosphate/cardiolipin synthase-like enzyme
VLEDLQGNDKTAFPGSQQGIRHPLHAKLYLIYRRDRATPIISYVGSSNLTLSGLRSQGELNVEVVDRDDTNKLE